MAGALERSGSTVTKIRYSLLVVQNPTMSQNRFLQSKIQLVFARLRMGAVSMGMWILLTLLSLHFGSASAQASEISSPLFSATGKLFHRPNSESLRTPFVEQTCRLPCASIGTRDPVVPLSPNPKSSQIWLFQQSVRLPAVSIYPKGRRLSAQRNSTPFRNALAGQALCKASVLINLADSSSIVRAALEFQEGLSLGGCGH